MFAPKILGLHYDENNKVLTDKGVLEGRLTK